MFGSKTKPTFWTCGMSTFTRLILWELRNDRNVTVHVMFEDNFFALEHVISVYSLFGGVVELVLVGATEALLHACVRPEPLHRRQQLLAERLRVFHPLDHVKHHLAIAL